MYSFLKQTKVSSFFTKIKNKKSEQVPSVWLVPVGGGRMWGEGVGEWIWCKYCIHMYVNEKMKPVKLFQEWGKWGIKANGGGGEFHYDIL
jgi:hypothetical protein